MTEFKFNFDTEGYNANLNLTLQPGDVVKVEEVRRYMTKIGDRPKEMIDVEAIVYKVTHNGNSHEVVEYNDLIEKMRGNMDGNFIEIKPKTKGAKK